MRVLSDVRINPQTPQYWLRNAHIPRSLLADEWIDPAIATTWEDLAEVDLKIQDGKIAAITASATATPSDLPEFDLRGGQVWPCFVDLHTHLDKGHIWNRAPNPDSTFANALNTVDRDRQQNWDAEDIYRRMEFGLQCSYAHGTQAIRTHLDSLEGQAEISFEVFKALRSQWADRMILQAVSLAPLDYFLTPDGEKLADQVAEMGGVLGGVAYQNPDLTTQLDRVFALAQERHLPLDFHADETDDPASQALSQIAEAALRHDFSQQIVCGHCCSLAVQSSEVVETTIQQVKSAKIGVVSLPLCNLYLQDRQANRTPRWRGVTLLHELKAAGVPVVVASDNCRDPFHGFGDHDGLEVFTLSARIAHFDQPYGDWPTAVTRTPADLMGLPTVGRIGVGLPADLVVFRARNYSELLSRSQHDRTVLRQGQAIDTTLPDYAILDDLLEKSR